MVGSHVTRISYFRNRLDCLLAIDFTTNLYASLDVPCTLQTL